MWKKSDRLIRIVQRPRDNIDQYYQFQVSENNKTEKLIKDTKGVDFIIPIQMRIHKFIEGLRNNDIREKLYIENLTRQKNILSVQLFLNRVLQILSLEQSDLHQALQVIRPTKIIKNRDSKMVETPLDALSATSSVTEPWTAEIKKSNLNSMRYFGCKQEGHKVVNCPMKTAKSIAVKATLTQCQMIEEPCLN